MRAWPNSLSLLVTTESQFRVSDQNLSLIDEGTVALYKADIYNIFWASKWAETVVNWASLTDLRRRGRWIWRLGDGCWPDTDTLHCRTGSHSPPAAPSPDQWTSATPPTSPYSRCPGVSWLSRICCRWCVQSLRWRESEESSPAVGGVTRLPAHNVRR